MILGRPHRLMRWGRFFPLRQNASMHYEDRDAAWGPVTRAEYRQEPYVRCELTDGTTVDGKAHAWTTGQVLVHWQDEDWVVRNQWMDSYHVTRIQRDESAWRDPYDDYAHFYPDLPER